MQTLAPQDDVASRADPPSWLIAAVSASCADVAGQQWVALRGGRTNRLWRAGGWVVKLFDPTAESPLFPNDPTAEALALRRFAAAGLAPRLRAQGAGWIAYDHVPGSTWSGDPLPVAVALGRLHALPTAGFAFRRLASGSAALIAQATAILAQCRGILPPPPGLHLPPLDRPRIIHGDAVAGNLVAGADGITLIDWQCPAIGDPAEDLAAFLSPAMQWLYRGSPLMPAEAEAFLAAYPDPRIVSRYRTLAPLFHWRMAAHCLWKAERGASDYAAALQLELAAL